MRLGGTAAFLADISSSEELVEALTWADTKKLPVIMIGGGSNIIWRDEGFEGLVLVSKMMGITFHPEKDGHHEVTIGSGEIWDTAVAQTVKKGLTGIEALSLIPGTAGGTPVQNVGAYGQEIAQTLVSVEAYDNQQKTMVAIAANDCAFGYRTSRFKTTDKGRFFITAITLQLTKGSPTPPFYGAVQHYFQEHTITDVTPLVLRDAVIAIRTSKLPDPAVVANNGSFFANPIISTAQFATLQAAYPDIPHWPATDEQIKIPTAWLLEQAGFKDYHDTETGMATYAKQPLVLVNERARSTAQLLAFRQKITDAIQQKFGITLKQEPEILPLP
jgi:UDP-N-acetylmuramate dehydrogenase